MAAAMGSKFALPRERAAVAAAFRGWHMSGLQTPSGAIAARVVGFDVRTSLRRGFLHARGRSSEPDVPMGNCAGIVSYTTARGFC